ncbi:cation-transporting P-type ATPase [Spongiactinospora sp. TRM90649]|uniref:cation-translocating P-type ATPase n=1 Tax=Spongiactinospora sp. TRM90649 TaxID=3031114 RepID=UPI0023F857CA|nr:cation-transporting P-type ATPase [Spongiactinospora sp. TRM90649]MDF5754348.1 cation-transporting P-type ATPase [Spongiactinospora sp. TRM90649]
MTPSSPGLSSAQAAALLERNGPNQLPQRPPVPVWRRVASQLRDPLIIVLLIAAVLTVTTGDWADAFVIALVIVVNTTVGVVQEIRADRAITALAELAAPEARVVRDGRQRLIPAADVVTGDLLVLAEGDVIPADGETVESAAMLVDESALTGESVPVDKGVGAPLGSGTVVVRGRGRALVKATGAASASGRIAALMVKGATLTPLQRRLAGVGRMLAGVAVLLSAVVLALGLVRGQPVELMIVTAISLVVAAVPESLPAVVTLSLALGARRMAARNALVRKLPAVETLGSVTALATDKTGTLTEGRMVARWLWTPSAEAAVSGSGYAPEGEIGDGGPDRAAFTELLTAAVLCNDARLSPPSGADGEWAALGDPTEAALLAAAAKAGLDRAEVQAGSSRVAELPFDSDRKRMSTVHRQAADRFRLICKGAPEALLLPGVLDGEPKTLARAVRRADELARDGYRVLAVASRDLTAVPEPVRESGLTLLGLIAILDPPRAEAATAVADCKRAGIRPLLITGDHPGTARAIATDLGIIDAGDRVVDCRVPGALDDGQAGVYARATPEQKLDIIRGLQDRGGVLAMTGDGVNDGPALHRADIGVAMGRRGTEVARQAADLVLADDNLDTVVAAVEEGRRVYANIRRFLVYGLSGGAAEIAVMLLGPFVGLPLPLLPAQILWINLLTHGLPGVALGGEPGVPGAMAGPPRPPGESILGAGLWQRVVRVAFVLAAVTLGVAVWAAHTGRPWQTMAFFALAATQLGVALGSRTRPGSRANPLLPLAVAGAFVLQLAALYVPPLRQLLGTQPLVLGDLLIVTALSVLGYAAARLDRILHPSRHDRPPARS